MVGLCQKHKLQHPYHVTVSCAEAGVKVKDKWSRDWLVFERNSKMRCSSVVRCVVEIKGLLLHGQHFMKRDVHPFSCTFSHFADVFSGTELKVPRTSGSVHATPDRGRSSPL